MTAEMLTSSRNESADMTLKELLNSLEPRAKVILPGDENFQSSKHIWNAMYDSKNPAIIVQVVSVGDVQACIKYAHKANIVVTPRGGGHSWSGLSTIDGGLVIDFALMRSIQVNPSEKEVTIEPGILLRELDHETQTFGLATPLGVISCTGVFGLVLGGGLGWLSRKHGASVDNIVSANIILANGSFVTASANQNPDLFWGIRGAAQYFGIVTSLTMKVHPVSFVYRGIYSYPLNQISEVLHGINDFMQTAPGEFNCSIESVGRKAGRSEIYLNVFYIFYMPEKEAESCADPLRTIGKPVKASWDWITHVQTQTMFDMDLSRRYRQYGKLGSINFSDMDARFIEAFRRSIETATSPAYMIKIMGIGGAMKDYPAEHSVFFTLRSQDWIINILAAWKNDVDEKATQEQIDACDSKHISWCQKAFMDMSTNLPSYINLMSDFPNETQGKRLERFFGPNLKQLQDLKKRCDPQNFFRHNLNILPTVEEDF